MIEFWTYIKKILWMLLLITVLKTIAFGLSFIPFLHDFDFTWLIGFLAGVYWQWYSTEYKFKNIRHDEN